MDMQKTPFDISPVRITSGNVSTHRCWCVLASGNEHDRAFYLVKNEHIEAFRALLHGYILKRASDSETCAKALDIWLKGVTKAFATSHTQHTLMSDLLLHLAAGNQSIPFFYSHELACYLCYLSDYIYILKTA